MVQIHKALKAKRLKLNTNRPGQVMILSFIFLIIVMLLGVALFSQTSTFIGFNSRSTSNEQATNAAEAGIDIALWKLNAQGYSGYNGESNTVLTNDKSSFSVTVTQPDPYDIYRKDITSTGYIPNATNPKAKRTVKVTTQIDATRIAFNYAVQVKNNVQLYQSTTVNGSIYSNGPVSGLFNSVVTADVSAYSITSPWPNVQGVKTTGVPIIPLPVINYQNWKDLSCNANPTTHVCDTNYVTTCSPTCTINTSQTIGPRKYSGNLTINGGASTITVEIGGPVYVTGNLTISAGNTTVKPAESLGNLGATILTGATSSNNISSNVHLAPNSGGGYLLLIFGETSGSTTVQSTDARAIFHGEWGGLTLSDNSRITSAAVNSLTMNNFSQLIYDSGLPVASFSIGPGAPVVVKPGTYRFASSP